MLLLYCAEIGEREILKRAEADGKGSSVSPPFPASHHSPHALFLSQRASAVERSPVVLIGKEQIIRGDFRSGWWLNFSRNN